MKRALQLEDDSLVRGVDVNLVLQGAGRVLSAESWHPSYYELSAPVEEIDAFISHNTTTPRFAKFLALAFFFNLVPALTVATVVCMIVFLLTVLEVMPVFPLGGQGFACQLIGLLAFVGTLLGWHEVAPKLGLKGPTVFLDRVCVHQHDPELKQRGIASLPAALYHSRSLLAVYTDAYLQKVWTIYEVTTFRLLFPNGKMHIQPTMFPPVVLLGAVFTILGRVFWVTWVCRFDEQIAAEWAHVSLRWLMYSPLAVGFGFMLRWWAREQACMEERVSTFSLRSASAMSEDDRKVVESRIAMLALHFKVAPCGAGKEDVFDAFNALVQRDLPSVLRASVGRMGFSYSHAATIFAIFMPFALDMVASQLLYSANRSAGTKARLLTAAALWTCAMVFAFGPLTVALCFRVQKALLGFHGARGALAVCIGALAELTVHVLCTYYLADFLWKQVKDHDRDWPIGILALVNAVFLGIALWAYRARLPECRQKEDSCSATSSDSEHEFEGDQSRGLALA